MSEINNKLIINKEVKELKTKVGDDTTGLLKDVKDLKENGVSQDNINTAVNNYLTEHPVSSGATAEQAAQIEANNKALNDINVLDKTLNFYTPEDQTNDYADSSLKSTDIFARYDALLGTKTDGYKVTKENLGKDQSNTYDIFKYIFEPTDYKRTIILSSGMHGIEIVPIFTIMILMENIVNNPSINEFCNYLRNNVRIVVVPIYNPWGFNQTPRVYCNSRNVNPNRNFGIKSEWDAFEAPTYSTDGFNGKGTAPFSEIETRIMRDVVNEYKNSADFWVDCHTSKGWDYDYYVQCNEKDTKVYNGISNALVYIRDYMKNSLSISNIKGLFNDPNTALKLHYSYKMLGVSCFTVEMTPKRFGGSENGKEDIKNYLLHLSNYIIGCLNEFSNNKFGHTYERIEKVSQSKTIQLQSQNGSKFLIYITDDGVLKIEKLGEETVIDVPTIGLTLDKTSINLIVGSEKQLTATYKENDTSSDVTNDAIWSVDNANCTVTNGLVSAISEGTSVVTATYNEQSVTCSINVLSESGVATTTLTAKLSGISSTDGSISESTTRFHFDEYIPAPSDTWVNFNCSNSDLYFLARCYDSNKNYLGIVQMEFSNSGSIITLADTSYVRFMGKIGEAGTEEVTEACFTNETFTFNKITYNLISSLN